MATTKVELPLDMAIAWQATGRGDEMYFAMQLIRYFIQQGFLVNPNPELRTIEVEVRRDSFIFEKIKREK